MALETNLPYLNRRADLDVIGAQPNLGRPHILIEGDNLHALTVLRGTHAAKVDLIYIDPPYNTGKEFIYNDKFIDSEHSFRHSAWLDFMWRRLKIAKELLKETGVIMISIDDNEQANLKLLCDEVFGESNFLKQLVWKSNTKPANQIHSRRGIQKAHEYILVYARDVSRHLGFDTSGGASKQYPHTGQFGKCRFESFTNASEGMFKRDKSVFPILGVMPPEGRNWKIGRAKADELVAAGKIELVDGEPRIAKYPEDESESIRPFWTLLPTETKTAETGKALLTGMIGSGHGFETVKPLELISEILRRIDQTDTLVLDFFAGSGTTGHAVAALNAEDGGTRQCIMVTLDESGICQDLTRKRMEAALTGKWANDKEHEALPGSLVFLQADGFAKLPDFTGSEIDWNEDLLGVGSSCLSESVFLTESAWTSLPSPHRSLRVARNDSGTVVAYWTHSYVSKGALDALREISQDSNAEHIFYATKKVVSNLGGTEFLSTLGWRHSDKLDGVIKNVNAGRLLAIRNRNDS